MDGVRSSDGEIVTLSAVEEKDIQSDWEIFMKAAKINPRRKNVLQQFALK
jgi:hypothetical protein